MLSTKVEFAIFVISATIRIVWANFFPQKLRIIIHSTDYVNNLQFGGIFCAQCSFKLDVLVEAANLKEVHFPHFF